MSTQFVPYSDSVETIQPDEQKTFDDIAATMKDIMHKIGDRQRHTTRAVHAKSHALVKAELTINADLPEPLAQGLAAQPGTYGVVMRFSTNPGDILSDHISSPRGLAIKIVGLDAEKVSNHTGEVTQDFLMVNGPVFDTKDAAGFLKNMQLLDKNANAPEAVKQAVSTASRIGENVLEAVGLRSSFLKGFGEPANNPLGEVYFTQAPLRWGNYFGKVALVPVSENLLELYKKGLPHKGEWNALRNEFSRFFKEEQEAVWELRVQLCTDLGKMPVEDAHQEWSEKESPYLAVATMKAKAQEIYSDGRRVYVDEKLSFNPWHALAAHRPLGNINRARFQAYLMSTKFRTEREGRERLEPESIDELPD